MAAVTMWHPQSAQTMQASEDAYERVWKQQGWQLVDQPEGEKPAKAPRTPRKATAGKADQ